MATEKQFPKSDGDIFYASEANAVSILSGITAGENINATNVVYINTADGKAYLGDTNVANDIRADGLAMEDVSSGATVNIITRGTLTGGVFTSGSTYYLAGTGSYGTQRSAVKIGRAITSTAIFVNIIQDDRDELGTIKSWNKHISGSVPYSAFWRDCNGTAVNDVESPYHGGTMPPLNGDADIHKLFIRGGYNSGTGGASTHTHSPEAAGNLANDGTGSSWHLTTNSHIPPYFETPFIMKVK